LIRASRNFVKAQVWLVLGLIFGSWFTVLGTVGYLGCFFYLLRTLDGVKAIKHQGDYEVRVKELDEEIARIREEESQ